MRWTVAVTVALAAVVGCRGGDETLPVLGSVPAFRLTDRDGSAFDSRRLEGRPWVAGFIFTSCPDVCPAVTAQMKRVQDDLAGVSGGTPLVSFSVDPTHDTAERLDEYARRYGAGASWHFLTGDRTEMAHLLTQGFKVAFADDGPATNPITHSDRLVLVDGTGRIRGYYHGRSTPDVDRLIADASHLATRGG